MSPDILALLTDAANRYGLPPALVIAQAQQESGGNPNAVSPAGAQGVMQLMPATAASLGVTDPFDPVQNIDAGVRYLAQLLKEFNGDQQLALAAYNWGPGNVSKNGFENWPSETVHYVSTILSNAGSAVASLFTGSPDPGTDVPPGSGSGPSGGEILGLAIAGIFVFLALTGGLA